MSERPDFYVTKHRRERRRGRSAVWVTDSKNLRNGPCGGVRLDGHCEVKPEMECVWLRAYEGSQRWPWPEEFHELRAPVDWRLKNTSSWVNYWTGRDEIVSGCAREPHSALEVVDADE